MTCGWGISEAYICVQDIEPAELVADLLGGGCQRLFAGDVDLDGLDPLSDAFFLQLLHSGFPFGQSAAADEHVKSLAVISGELSRDLEADPSVPAGHEHNLFVRACHV